jgi:membrane protease YdiL (CAAX protease family)
MRRVALLAAPPLVLVTETLAFSRLGRRLGPRWGYLGGFLVYWIGWGLLFPLAVLPSGRRRGLFREPDSALGKPRWLGLAALLAPPALGLVGAFPAAVREADLRTVLASVGIAAANATVEEVLWRGLFLEEFPDDAFKGWLYPSLGFGLWHLAPQTIFPSRSPGGRWSFVAVATAVGLLYGRLAWNTRSIRWTTLSHVLFDSSGLGARIYFR